MTATIHNLDDFRDVVGLADSYYRLLVANAMTVMAEEEFQQFKVLVEGVTVVTNH